MIIISSTTVSRIVPDNGVKFSDHELSQFWEIRLQVVGDGIVTGFFSRMEVGSEDIYGANVVDIVTDACVKLGISKLNRSWDIGPTHIMTNDERTTKWHFA